MNSFIARKNPVDTKPILVSTIGWYYPPLLTLMVMFPSCQAIQWVSW